MSADPLIAEVLERLASGESPAEILATTRPVGEHEILMRCAAVRTFDRPLFDEVLWSAESPGFDDIVQASEIEPVARQSGVFRVRASARSALWSAWWRDASVPPTEVPEPLADLARRLADHFAAEEESLDALVQLILVAPDEAASLVRSLYREYDERFDIAGCQDLIDVLSDPDRASLLTSELKALRADRVAYLKARSLWSAEYFQTTTFVEPAGVMDAYLRLLAGGGRRVLNLHAPGGSGKTIQLRWLISRRLVPEHEPPDAPPLGAGRIPCARVDFDYIEAVNATKYPWLVLLELAAQLNEQIPGAPFNEALEQHGWAVPLLRRNPTDSERVKAASNRMRIEGARAAQRLPRQLATGLRESIGDAPVVVVVDTLEEVHLRPQGNLEALLREFAALLDRCAGVRLILAGRYAIPEILGDAAGVLPPLDDAEIAPLSGDEAERYLSERRGLPAGAVTHEIALKADGDPFVLSLLADIVQERPKLTAGEIRRYPADVIRLIRRVVNRIQEDEVRWLLRYGVVPRTLGLEFVRDVMEPHLRRGMSGRSSLDTPSQDDIPGSPDGTGPAFPTDVLDTPDAALDLAEVWTRLRRYAGSTSWVFEVPGPDPDSPRDLRFRSDVVNAMRRVIRPRRVYARLHADAATYYDRKAREDAEQWDRWTREALYHRFQLEGARAERHWRQAFAAAGFSPTRRESIAAELLEPDYIDELGRPRAFDDTTPMVTSETLVEAHFERAAALTELARLQQAGVDDPLWTAAERSLRAAEAGQRALGRRVVPPFRMAYVEAGRALRDGRHEEAQAHLRRALRSARAHADVARLRTLLGDTQFARGDPAAAKSYRDALRAAEHLPTAREWQCVIRRRLVAAERELDHLKEADGEARKALGSERSESGRLELRRMQADTALRAGRRALAEREASALHDDTGDWDAWQIRVRAAAARADPVRALALAARVPQASSRSAAGAPTSMLEAAGQELLGFAWGLTMDFEHAFTHLEKARSLWQGQGVLEAIARCYARAARLNIRGVGDLNVAEQHLNEADRLELHANGEGWLDRRLLRAELLVRQGHPERAAGLNRSTVEQLRLAKAPPRRLVRAAVEGLAIGEPSDRLRLLDVLLAAAARITPPSARVVLLRGLDRVDELPGKRVAERLESLRHLARLPRDPRLEAHDRALLKLIASEIDRIAGDRDAARSKLLAARAELAQGGSAFYLRDLCLAADRLALGTGALALTPQDVETFLAEFDQHSMLCAALLVDHAAAIVDTMPHWADDLLATAGEYLDRAPTEGTQLHARALQARASAAERQPAGFSSLELFGAAAGVLVGLGFAWKTIRRELNRGERLAALDETRATVRLDLGPDDSLEVTTSLPARPGAPRRFDRAQPLIADLVPELTGERFAFSLVERWLHDWCRAGRELGELLLGPAERELLEPGSRVDLRLELARRRLNTIPWELARTPGDGVLLAQLPRIASLSRCTSSEAGLQEEVSWVQVALNHAIGAPVTVDGRLGPKTVAALRQFQSARDLPADGHVGPELLRQLQLAIAAQRDPHLRPRVILVQPSIERQFGGDRGLASVGVDIRRLYEDNDFEVWTVENATVDEIRGAISVASSPTREPAILHLCGGLRESGGGVAFTFLAGEWYSESLGGTKFSDDLPVTALDHILDGFSRDTLGPLLVLDVDQPHGLTETMTHLLLRNAFAGELFALGSCPAVLATGLVGDHAAHRFYDHLIGSLARRQSVGETCAVLHQLAQGFDSPSALELAIGPASTALFSHVPWLRPTLS